MNLIEKEKVRYWRGEGLGYKAVAAKTGISESAVKAFCQRSGLGGEYKQDACRQCGTALVQRPGTRKKFCSAFCRNTWWNHHTYLREEKDSERRACAVCGREFLSNASASRKYCGHPCYIAARFGKEMCRRDP
jgi:hypothetical protein